MMGQYTGNPADTAAAAHQGNRLLLPRHVGRFLDFKACRAPSRMPELQEILVTGFSWIVVNNQIPLKSTQAKELLSLPKP